MTSRHHLVTDTRTTIETPEGADRPLDPAGVLVRISAFLIDFAIRAAVFIAFSIVLALMGGVGRGVMLIAYFLLEWFYPVYFEVWRQGRTPGKKSMGIEVVNEDGTPVTFAASLIRNLLRFVDFLPTFYIAGVITSICNPRFKRIGDLAAGTLVVYSHRQSKPAVELDVSERAPVPADFSTDEQRALLNFAERSVKLSRERQRELAMILEPLIGERDTVNTIKKMANSTLGAK